MVTPVDADHRKAEQVHGERRHLTSEAVEVRGEGSLELVYPRSSAGPAHADEVSKVTKHRKRGHRNGSGRR
jgi:hypothetical protein